MVEKYFDKKLPTAEVGAWSERKYKLIELYSNMFTTSMKNKWDCRVYIDLFCGCGLAKIKGSKRIIPTSPILALDTNEKFDKYIFCDIDREKLDTLKQHVVTKYPNVNSVFVCKDINKSIDYIISLIPEPSRYYKVLSFCLVDPYKISDLCFSTIERLSSKRFVDFLVLIPSFMDANRNLNNYLKNDYIDKFLGNTSWRDEWRKREKNISFATFIVEQFNKQMVGLGFIGLEPNEFIIISEPTRNCPLYHLAFYSKNQLGKKFWRNAIKGSDPQLSLQF